LSCSTSMSCAAWLEGAWAEAQRSRSIGEPPQEENTNLGVCVCVCVCVSVALHCTSGGRMCSTASASHEVLSQAAGSPPCLVSPKCVHKA